MIRYLTSVCTGLFFFAGIAGAQPKLPDTPQGKIVQAYLEAFNSGDEAKMKDFFLQNVSKEGLAVRPLEARLARTKEIQGDVKSLTVDKILTASDKTISLLAKSGRGETLTLTFEFEPNAPPKFGALRIEMGEAQAVASGPPLKRDEFVAAVGQFLDARVKDDRFSGAVLVARGTEILFKKAFGFAEKRFGVPNRTDTKFNLGSINKFFTRLAVAQLAEQGKLSLGDPVIKYLSDYPNRQAAEKIKISQLLDMTSGLGDFFGDKFDGTPKDKIRSLRDYLPFFINDPLLFEPGADRRYSNAGYIVLGLVIEKLSGQDYYSYVRERIFKPAAMPDTDSYEMDAVTPSLATGYRRPNQGSTGWVSNVYTAPARGSSAGGGYSTVEDLFAFLQALRNGKLLTAKYLSWMLTGDIPASDPALPLAQGAIGIAGGAEGINGDVEFDAKNGDAVIVLGNYGPPAAMEVAAQLRGLLKRLIG